MPATIEELARCKTIYTELPGWSEDITKAKSFAELPRNAQDYVKFIEEQTNIPITWIGNGPKREEMIIKH
jgi:adenylosuccinate synthase